MKEKRQEKKVVYAVGILYDDFCDGGFEVLGICDSIERAKQMCQDMHKAWPSVDMSNIAIHDFEMNRFYVERG